MQKKRPIHYRLMVALLVLLNTIQPQALASTTASYYSAKEYAMAQQMMLEIRASGKLFPDPIVTDYVKHIGNRLRLSSNSRKPLNFFVVNEANINAFAGPAGYIGINAGLILAADTESELASVMAHEIAHVTQNHLQRGLQAASQANLGKVASMLAAIALGFVSAGAATSAIALGMAGTQQGLLNFSRSNEFEADQIGIRMLYKSGFDPSAMMTFFQRLRQEERYYDRPPELLMTHPYVEERIAQASNRLANMKPKKLNNPFMFYLVRERIRNALSDNPHKLITYYQQVLQKKTYHNKAACEYGYGLALLYNHRGAQAMKHLSPLLKEYPDNVLFQIAMGHAEFDLGRDVESLNHFKHAYNSEPNNFAVLYWYTKTLMDIGQASKSIRITQDYLRAHPNDNSAYDILAQAQATDGQIGKAYQTRAKLFLAYNDRSGAINQLTMAKNSGQLSKEQNYEIQQQILSLKQESKPH